MTISVRVLGPVAVDGPSGPLVLGAARQRSVLVVLLLSAGRPVPTAELIGRVWGEQPPPAAEQALRSYLCRLRQTLAPCAAIRLERRDGGYVAAVEDGRLDLTVFRQLAGRARVAVRDGRHAQALHGFDDALALTEGPLLAGVDSDWLDEQRRLLDRERLAVALERNDLALATGSPELVVADAVSRLREEPYDERVAGQAVLALAGVGRTAEALQVYEEVRRRLVDELGIDPGPALRDVQQRVLRGAPAVRAVQRAAVVPRQLPPAVRGFVDRTGESRQLDQLVPSAEDEPSTVVVCGPGGVGKTALAVHWARRHADRFPDGQLYVHLHGYDPDHRPTRSDVALRGLLGALGVEPGAIPSDLAEMVAAYRTLLANRSVLLVADDVVSAEQVRALLPPGPGSLAVVTSRSGLADLAVTTGAQVLPVGMFDEPAARELLVSRLGAARTAAEPEAVARLVRHCGGLPLALAILAGRAAAVPSLSLSALADDVQDESRRLVVLRSDDCRTDLEAVVATSVAILSSTAHSVLRWLAAGPQVTITRQMVAALADLSVAAADEALRELLGIHLLEADGVRRYRLHDLVRLAVRARPASGLDAAVDRLLAFMITDDVEVGVEDRLAAAAYAEQTGRDAALADLAAALVAPLGSAGRWSELVVVSGQARRAAERLGDDHRRTTALIGRGRGRIGLREFDAAGVDLAEALAVAERLGDIGLQARARRALARWGAHQHRWEVALHHDRIGLELHRVSGDALGEAHARNAVGWHLAHLGRPDEALASCQQALTIFVERDDRGGQALTLDSIGFAFERLQRLTEAQEAYRQGVLLCRELGGPVLLANTLTRLADVCARLGRDHEADAAREEAEAILEISGHQVLEP